MVYDSSVPSGSFFHYLVVNAPGCDATKGTAAFDYLFSFGVDVLEDGTVNPNPGNDYFHRHVHQCFAQRSELDINSIPSASGCDGVFTVRGDSTPKSLIKDLNLYRSPVCANILKVPFTPASTNGVCQLARCSDFGVPLPLAGVTDQPECAEGATGPYPPAPTSVLG